MSSTEPVALPILIEFLFSFSEIYSSGALDIEVIQYIFYLSSNEDCIFLNFLKAFIKLPGNFFRSVQNTYFNN